MSTTRHHTDGLRKRCGRPWPAVVSSLTEVRRRRELPGAGASCLAAFSDVGLAAPSAAQAT